MSAAVFVKALLMLVAPAAWAAGTRGASAAAVVLCPSVLLFSVLASPPPGDGAVLLSNIRWTAAIRLQAAARGCAARLSHSSHRDLHIYNPSSGIACSLWPTTAMNENDAGNAACVQAAVRGWLARRLLGGARAAAAEIQAATRGLFVRSGLAQAALLLEAAIAISAAWRGSAARRRLRAELKARAARLVRRGRCHPAALPSTSTSSASPRCACTPLSMPLSTRRPSPLPSHPPTVLVDSPNNPLHPGPDRLRSSRLLDSAAAHPGRVLVSSSGVATLMRWQPAGPSCGHRTIVEAASLAAALSPPLSVFPPLCA